MFALTLLASADAAQISSLERFSAIVAPYTRCEMEGKAELKPDQEAWSAAAKASYQEPDDAELKARSDKLMREMQIKSQSIRDRCGYEKVHKALQSQILELHPNMQQSDAFWFSRQVFHSLNDLNALIVKYEHGEFPQFPLPPTAAPAK